MYTNILHATDLSNEHSHLAQQAADIAKHFNANLYLLHVIELPTSVQLAQGLGFTELAHPVKDDAQTVLSMIGDSVGVPAERQIVEIGSVKDHIFNAVKQFNCQLIIIGSHSFHGLPAFLGNTASITVNHAPCDVMTLRV